AGESVGARLRLARPAAHAVEGGHADRRRVAADDRARHERGAEITRARRAVPAAGGVLPERVAERGAPREEERGPHDLGSDRAELVDPARRLDRRQGRLDLHQDRHRAQPERSDLAVEAEEAPGGADAADEERAGGEHERVSLHRPPGVARSVDRDAARQGGRAAPGRARGARHPAAARARAPAAPRAPGRIFCLVPGRTARLALRRTSPRAPRLTSRLVTRRWNAAFASTGLPVRDRPISRRIAPRPLPVRAAFAPRAARPAFAPRARLAAVRLARPARLATAGSGAPAMRSAQPSEAARSRRRWSCMANIRVGSPRSLACTAPARGARAGGTRSPRTQVGIARTEPGTTRRDRGSLRAPEHSRPDQSSGRWQVGLPAGARAHPS